MMRAVPDSGDPAPAPGLDLTKDEVALTLGAINFYIKHGDLSAMSRSDLYRAAAKIEATPR